LVPLNQEKVISKLQAKKKTPTPPGSSNSNQSFYLGKTPKNLYKLSQQKEQLQELQDQALYLSITKHALKQVIKAAEISMQKATLLQHENPQLRSENLRQRRKKDMP
jgi:hypothetical protein